MGKVFKKQIKTIEDHGRKQVNASKVLKPKKNQQDLKSVEGIFPKEMRNNEIENEIQIKSKNGKKILK